MTKWIAILGGLLAVQLALALALNLTGQEYGAYQSADRLLSFDAQRVDGLRIEEAAARLQLKKRDGKWQLPEQGGFPADQGAVEQLLTKLAGIQKGLPVATTAGALRRFKVADEQFEHRLSLMSGDSGLAQLFVGTSPGFRKVHVRPAGGDKVFAVAFDSWELSAKADDWIDKGVVKLAADQLLRVEMPGFKLTRQGGELKLEGLAEGEKTNQEAAQGLMERVAGLRVESLLGSEEKPDYQQDRAGLEIQISHAQAGTLGYRFSKPKEGDYYVLKRSDLGFYLKVASHQVDAIKEVTRERLVLAGPNQAAVQPGGAEAGEKPEAAAAATPEGQGKE